MATVIRVATIEDLPAIVRLLADDDLGATRERVEDPLPPAYERAFREIEASPDQELITLEFDGAVVGTMQLTYMAGLSHQGMRRLEIEAVRVERSLRSRGLGETMIRWAMERARERGCGMVQLTSNKSREGAHRFYKRLGFAQSHEGFKRLL